MTKLILFIITFIVINVDSYKILIVFPTPSKSHAILGEGYVRNLLLAGHEVTYITSFPPKISNEKLKIYHVIRDKRDHDLLKFDLTSILNGETTTDIHVIVNNIKRIHTNYLIEDKEVQALMMNPIEKFDLVVTEWFFSEISCGLAAVFDCPFVWSSSVEPHSVLLNLIDDWTNPAYNAGFLFGGAVSPYSFKQRALELVALILAWISKYLIIIEKEEYIYENAFGPILAAKGRQLLSFNELRFGASAVFGNSHVSYGESIRLPQNYFSIGGYHIDDNLPTMPEDLQKIMYSAENGVIYFSMGSILKSELLPIELKSKLINVFGSLNYTILWKFEEVLPNLPSNVHIVSWAPQTTVLAHPKTILFITHCGLLSTIEAIKFGVPVIGIPAFGDQFNNIKRSVSQGFAKQVDLSLNLAEDLKNAVDDILGDAGYAKRAKQMSYLFKDRIVPPGEELVYWIEHIIRTNGAKHRQSPALHLAFYKKAYLDLLAIVLVFILIIWSTFKYLFKKIKSKIYGQKEKKQ